MTNTILPTLTQHNVDVPYENTGYKFAKINYCIGYCTPYEAIQQQ